jgi:hypothetical protein
MPGLFTVKTADGALFESLDEDRLRLWRDEGRIAGETLVAAEGTEAWRRLDATFDLALWNAPPLLARPRQARLAAPPDPFGVSASGLDRQPVGAPDWAIVVGTGLAAGLITLASSRPQALEGPMAAGYILGATLLYVLVFGIVYLPLRSRFRRWPSLMGCGGIVLGTCFVGAIAVAFVGGIRAQRAKASERRRRDSVVLAPADMNTFEVAGIVTLKAPGPFERTSVELKNPGFLAAWSYRSSAPPLTVQVIHYTLKPGSYFMPAKALAGILANFEGQAVAVLSSTPARFVILEGGPASRADICMKMRANGVTGTGTVGMIAFASPKGDKEPRVGVVVLVTSEWGDPERDKKSVDGVLATLARTK